MRTRLITVVASIVAGAFGYCSLSAGADQGANPVQERDATKSPQHLVASKTAKFKTIAKDDPLYKNALDAHNLDGAHKLVGKEGSFKGTVDRLFEAGGGDMVVFDFDPNFRTALTAVLKKTEFPKFPVIKELTGKEIVVSGKFAEYHGKAQIELSDPKQIRVVKQAEPKPSPGK
jgi:hypothetical protein